MVISVKDVLCKDEILRYSDKEKGSPSFIVLDTVDSTNNYAKRLAAGGAEDGTVVVANEQTGGKGRMGRNFFSPPGTGIYMSVILRPHAAAAEAATATISACVAVCRVIERLSGCSPKIKWVNDIFSGGKKVCGILAEGAGDFHDGVPEYTVIGIGINVCTPACDFPEEIRKTAGSIQIHGITRNKIIAEIADEVLGICRTPVTADILAEYKSRLFLLGTDIEYRRGAETRHGRAVDVNRFGNLIVEDENGGTVVLSSGEVTLKSENFSGI